MELFENEYQSFTYKKSADQEQETKKIPTKDLFSYLIAFANAYLRAGFKSGFYLDVEEKQRCILLLK